MDGRQRMGTWVGGLDKMEEGACGADGSETRSLLPRGY
jgi:hypothetical protein